VPEYSPCVTSLESLDWAAQVASFADAPDCFPLLPSPGTRVHRGQCVLTYELAPRAMPEPGPNQPTQAGPRPR
jgi:hypothetical protein